MQHMSAQSKRVAMCMQSLNVPYNLRRPLKPDIQMGPSSSSQNWSAYKVREPLNARGQLAQPA